MLKLEGVEAGYHGAPVLQGVSLAVRASEVVALLGRNGMGKTTVFRSIMGQLPITGGRILLEGAALGSTPHHAIAARGIGLVPEGRQVFPNLTVRENLVATARRTAGGGWTLDRVLELFPRLQARLAAPGGRLSGGEQQMLAIGRALMTNPRLLLLDEATEGLAPLVRAEIWRVLRQLKATGQGILLVDKNLEAICRTAERIYLLEKGRIVWQGSSVAFAAEPGLAQRHLGV